jgi:hypothetical protein
MAEPYDYEKDVRPPCEFPVDGEISIDDFNPEGKYKDCKIDWSKEGSRLDEKALHFNVNYDVTKQPDKKEIKEDMPTKINPELITPPTELPQQPVKTVESIGVPQFNLAHSKSEVMQKAADPATTAAIVSTVVAVGANAATAYVMKLPQVQKILKQVNEILHKVSKGKLGKKDTGEKKTEEKQEEKGGECGAQHLQANAAIAALKAQIVAIEARQPESQPAPVAFDSEELEKAAKKLDKRIAILEEKLGIAKEEPKRGRKKKM